MTLVKWQERFGVVRWTPAGRDVLEPPRVLGITLVVGIDRRGVVLPMFHLCAETGEARLLAPRVNASFQCDVLLSAAAALAAEGMHNM